MMGVTLHDLSVDDLAARCAAVQAAWAAKPQAGFIEEFRFLYDPTDERPWRVGFYCDHQGKVVEDGATLKETLIAWLEDNEGREERLA